MRLSNNYQSPNFAPQEIPVEFVVLHYTAADLRRTMDIFMTPARQVCAHFVLDTDGTVYDLGGFWDGPIRQGAHAGESRLTIGGHEFTKLNTMSIGIEIVNLNGNLMPYTEAQYFALSELLRHLQSRFPALHLPERIVGHEHIAGFRGKCDPGIQFDWRRVLGDIGLAPLPLHSQFVFTAEDKVFADQELATVASPTPEDWSRLSSMLEQRIKARMT